MRIEKIKHLLALRDLTREEILELIDLAAKVKKDPGRYEKLSGKTLLMMFAKPSLRTHLSFEIAMQQLGGHAIFYDLSHSTLGQKESIKDFSKVISRYVDVVMARLFDHKQIEELAKYSEVPIINGLTDSFHPCQILGDLLTIKEKIKDFRLANFAYVGDCNNNITHDLIAAANKVGMGICISCPYKKEYMPNPKAVEGMRYSYEKDPRKAVYRASIIYTDTWMSYQVPKNQEKRRIRDLKPYQVNMKLMQASKKDPVFMHCLPAHRGQEVTDEVMDSNKSIIYDQAENRTYAEKAVLLKLLGKA